MKCQYFVDQMSVGQMSVGLMSVGQMSFGQMSVSQMSDGQIFNIFWKSDLTVCLFIIVFYDCIIRKDHDMIINKHHGHRIRPSTDI